MDEPRYGPGFRAHIEGYHDRMDLEDLVSFLNADLPDELTSLRSQLRREIDPLIEASQGSVKSGEVYDHLMSLIYTINSLNLCPKWNIAGANRPNRPNPLSRILGPARRVLKIDGEKWIVYRIFDATSPHRYLYGIVIASLESGDFASLRTCKECRKYFVADRLSQKFCTKACQKQFFDDRGSDRVRKSRDRKRKDKERRERQLKEQADRDAAFRLFSEFMKQASLRTPPEQVVHIVKQLGQGRSASGWRVVKVWQAQLRKGTAIAHLWDDLDPTQKKTFLT